MNMKNNITKSKTHKQTCPKLTYKVALMGCPMQPHIAWTDENMRLLVERGFNAMQLNIAWGARPGDEALNIEDVLVVPEDQEYRKRMGITKPDRSPKRIAERAADIRNRIAMCKRYGMRTIFHFGAPYIGPYDVAQGKTLERDVTDPAIIKLYQRLLRQLHAELPGIDDLLCYHYDQGAAVHSEFDVNHHHLGEPLHERVMLFINALGDTWHGLNPDGRLWLTLWEFSAGQGLRCVERLNGSQVGLSLHSNIGEVQRTRPVDISLNNICALAERRGIPVIVEGFLNAPSEEFEPCAHIQCPQLVLRQLRTIASIPTIQGIKEYYGIIPEPTDVTLQMTGLFFANPEIRTDEALTLLAKPYGTTASQMIEYWRLTSEAFDLIPYDASWLVRGMGRSMLFHGMNAAFVAGIIVPTPAWESTRRGIFMKTDQSNDHPWLLEDVQLRLEMASERLNEAITVGQSIASKVPSALSPMHDGGLSDLGIFSRRCVILACHLRETNLATVMRMAKESSGTIPDRMIAEMRTVLFRDQTAQEEGRKIEGGKAPGYEGAGKQVAEALALLDKNPGQFLDTYFKPAHGGGWGGNFTSRS